MRPSSDGNLDESAVHSIEVKHTDEYELGEQRAGFEKDLQSRDSNQHAVEDTGPELSHWYLVVIDKGIFLSQIHEGGQSITSISGGPCWLDDDFLEVWTLFENREQVHDVPPIFPVDLECRQVGQ